MLVITDYVQNWNECKVLSRLGLVVQNKWLKIVAMYVPETSQRDSYVSISVDGDEPEATPCDSPQADSVVIHGLIRRGYASVTLQWQNRWPLRD